MPEVDDPDPPTVSPTELLTAVTVPLIVATKVQSARALVSVVTVAWSWVTVASSWAMVEGVTCKFAWADCTVRSCAVIVDWSLATACW